MKGLLADHEEGVIKGKVKGAFLRVLNAHSPSELSYLIRQELMTNPCLGSDDEEEPTDPADSDVNEEPTLPLDDELPLGAENFHDEELGDEYIDRHNYRNKFSPSESFEVLENADLSSKGESEIAEAQASDPRAREILSDLVGIPPNAGSAPEAFLTIVYDEKTGQIVIFTQGTNWGDLLFLNEELKDNMRELYAEASDLIEGVRSHSRYLKHIAREIATRQKDFFREKGLRAAKGKLAIMTQTELAKQLGIHKSTISRFVKGKWIRTIWGLLPMQMFFGRSSKRAALDVLAAAEAKRSLIEEAIEVSKADSSIHLTNAWIVSYLESKGISMSGRMVSYYRKQYAKHAIRKRAKCQ